MQCNSRLRAAVRCALTDPRLPPPSSTSATVSSWLRLAIKRLFRSARGRFITVEKSERGRREGSRSQDRVEVRRSPERDLPSTKPRGFDPDLQPQGVGQLCRLPRVAVGAALARSRL